MEALTHTCFRDNIIITNIRRPVFLDRRMNSDIHILFNFHGFTYLAGVTLNQIVALAMGVQPFFFRVSSAF